MKRAIFVSVGTIAGLTATLRYTPEAPPMGTDSNLALGTTPQTAVEQSNSPSTKVTPTVPSVAKSKGTPKSSSGKTASASPKKSTGSTVKKPKPTKTAKPKPKPKKTSKPKVRPTKSPTSTPTTNASQKFSGTGEWAAGYGIVQVQITVANGKMTAITPLSWPTGGQSSMISGYAIPLLEREALNSQSSNVSTIGGATYTSEAFRNSLASAMANAGL